MMVPVIFLRISALLTVYRLFIQHFHNPLPEDPHLPIQKESMVMFRPGKTDDMPLSKSLLFLLPGSTVLLDSLKIFTHRTFLCSLPVKNLSQHSGPEHVHIFAYMFFLLQIFEKSLSVFSLSACSHPESLPEGVPDPEIFPGNDCRLSRFPENFCPQGSVRKPDLFVGLYRYDGRY